MGAVLTKLTFCPCDHLSALRSDLILTRNVRTPSRVCSFTCFIFVNFRKRSLYSRLVCCASLSLFSSRPADGAGPAEAMNFYFSIAQHLTGVGYNRSRQNGCTALLSQLDLMISRRSIIVVLRTANLGMC